MIIGIDQSFTSTGLCVYDGKEFTFEVIETKIDREDPLEKFRRAMYIADEIYTRCKELGITQVNIEGLAMGNIKGNANRDLASLQGVIVTKLLENLPDVVIKIITPTSLKKFATGKGNSKKDLVFEALPEDIMERLLEYPKTRGRFDLADAYWLTVFEEITDG